MSDHAVVLAAGKGTRMNSGTAKVLHRAAGRTLLDWALDALADVDRITVVVGHDAERVAAALPEGLRSVIQEPQNGTGHATAVALDGLDTAPDDTILVMPGDMPLIGADVVASLLGQHRVSGHAATVLTAVVADPTGYGRVVRSDDAVERIVEHRDADPAELEIDEINTSVYAFRAGDLVESLARVGTDNDQAEQYLTDVIAILRGWGRPVGALRVEEAAALGVNSHRQLAAASRALRARINEGWMARGVEMIDPDRVYIDADARLGPGVVLYPDVHIEGAATVAASAVIGPGVFIADGSVGERSRVSYSVLREAHVGADSVVGPYAHLRPGTRLADATKAGSFVEIKAATVGQGSKVPHLAYIGDATIGEASNIGAGSITVNYDGYAKHRTVIGDRVRIGSDTMLVAPVQIGDDASTGAGSVITRNVGEGALAVERSPQREIAGYAARRRRKADREQT